MAKGDVSPKVAALAEVPGIIVASFGIAAPRLIDSMMYGSFDEGPYFEEEIVFVMTILGCFLFLLFTACALRRIIRCMLS